MSEPPPIQSYAMRGNRVARRTIEQVVHSANGFCGYLRINRKTLHRMGEFIESLSTHSVCVDVIDDEEWWSGTDAVCDPAKLTIYVPNKLYRRACAHDADAVATFFHEIGHLILGHRALLHNERSAVPCREEDAEWQADLFANQVLFRMGIGPGRQLSFDF